MDEKFTELFSKWLEADMADKQARVAEVEAQKAADNAPQYVTADALKDLFTSFSAEVSKAIGAAVSEAVEQAVPVRAEGAGRAAVEAQKAADTNPIAALASKPVADLTREDKELKAAIVRYVAAKA